MRGIPGRYRKSVAHFPKEELKVKIHKVKDVFGPSILDPETFRYSANSFQQRPE